MDSHFIKVDYDFEDIDSLKTTDDKINMLLKIAFSNHKTLTEHGKLLFGNGEQGLCDRIRSHDDAMNNQKLSLIGLWSVFVIAVTGGVGWIIVHLSGK